MMQTTKENLFVRMQQVLQQAALNDHERRALIAKLEYLKESQKYLVKSMHTQITYSY